MSTYLSHPVRRVRDNPPSDDSVSLVVELDDVEPDTLTATVTELSGTVDCELQFDWYLTELPETAVGELCGLDGIARIETTETLSVAPRDPELPSKPVDELPDEPTDEQTDTTVDDTDTKG